ncbi:MAG: CRISPR system precrRNA processing endoribonuclease RAMP protein Cas6, partial [Chloroflexus sp.]|nr:CRISPR system precrRNA processing endoribonuclease RAMP protein Cas6 [Chloroflexus sp.]
KWNAFAPVALPAETRRFAEECLALTAYNLRTRMTPFKDGGLRPGAVGVARYTALNRDRYWLSVMHLLAEFAFFAGVGVGVTMGLGQCRQESGSPGDEPPERGPRAALDAL